MKKTYLVAPVVLLAGFLFIEHDAASVRQQKDVALLAQRAAEKAEAERVREEQAKTAAADTLRRAAEREAQDLARAEKKQRDLDALLAKLTGEAERQEAVSRALAEEVATLERQLAAARARRESLENGVFSLARQVEAHRVNLRTAELEVQRASKMVTVRLAEQPWLNDPTASPQVTQVNR